MEHKKIGVFIGRFQPLHIAHVLTIKRMIEEMDFVVISLPMIIFSFFVFYKICDHGIDLLRAYF